MSQEHAVVLVHSTGHALKAERVLRGIEVECKLIPVPRHLSSDCGVCVRIERDDRQRADRALRSAGMEIEGIHDI